MSLVLLQEPPEIFLSGNEAKFQVQVHFSSFFESSYSALWLGFGMPTRLTQVNYSLPAFRLEWNGITENIYVAISPGNSGSQIPRSIGYDTLSAYVDAIIEKLKLNPRITADFNITHCTTLWSGFNDYIIFTAYRRGSQYNLMFTRLNLENIVNHDIHYVAGTINPGMASMTVLKNAKSFLVTKNFVGNTLVSSFDIAPYCRDSKTGHFSFPEITGLYKIHNILTPVQASLGHIDSLSGVDSKFILSSVKYALDGKLSELKQSLINSVGQNLLQYLGMGSSCKFLTFSPRPKITDIYAPEKLYFIIPATGNYKILIKKYYKGTTRYVYTSEIAFTKNNIVEIQASYKAITVDDPYKIYSYEFSIVNAANYAVSETFKFIVDRTYQPYARYFLFKNSFGVYECVRTTGKVTKTTGITKTLADVSEPASMTSLARRLVQLSVKQDVEYEINTGYKPNDHNEWVTEFFSSPDVLFLKNTMAIPCNITEAKDTSNIDEREPEFRKAKMTHLYYEDFSHEATTELPLLPDFNNDYNKDFNSYSFAQTADYYGLASAGDDQVITILTGTLAAAALQQGVTGKWTLVSGPGSVVFSDDTSNTSNFTFDLYGTYVLRWTATNETSTDYDEITIRAVNVSEVTLVGDDNGIITDFKLYNVTSENSNNGQLYWKIEFYQTDLIFRIYKDAAKTTQVAVSQQFNKSGTASISQSLGSLITGSITLSIKFTFYWTIEQYIGSSRKFVLYKNSAKTAIAASSNSFSEPGIISISEYLDSNLSGSIDILAIFYYVYMRIEAYMTQYVVRLYSDQNCTNQIASSNSYGAIGNVTISGSGVTGTFSIEALGTDLGTNFLEFRKTTDGTTMLRFGSGFNMIGDITLNGINQNNSTPYFDTDEYNKLEVDSSNNSIVKSGDAMDMIGVIYLNNINPTNCESLTDDDSGNIINATIV